MASTKSAKEDITSNYGRDSLKVSIVYQYLLLLMIKFCACMEGFRRIWFIWIKLKTFKDPLRFRTTELSAICCGLIQQRIEIRKDSEKTKEESLIHSVVTFWWNF